MLALATENACVSVLATGWSVRRLNVVFLGVLVRFGAFWATRHRPLELRDSSTGKVRQHDDGVRLWAGHTRSLSETWPGRHPDYFYILSAIIH